MFRATIDEGLPMLIGGTGNEDSDVQGNHWSTSAQKHSEPDPADHQRHLLDADDVCSSCVGDGAALARRAASEAPAGILIAPVGIPGA